MYKNIREAQASAPDLTFRTVRKRKQERLRPCLNAGQSRLFCARMRGKQGAAGGKRKKSFHTLPILWNAAAADCRPLHRNH